MTSKTSKNSENTENTATSRWDANRCRFIVTYTTPKTIREWDAGSEEYYTITYTEMHHDNGTQGDDVEYHVAYRLIDGRWLCGTRLKDRGGLMIDVRILKRPRL